ncbi:putative disease resistance protein At4g27220 [Castanea sativa]|uniref:putative disease resistance protein At4g27220 n=1 Tax=Castanea sativa TaxID=21020 RepID=UPI003F64A9E4
MDMLLSGCITVVKWTVKPVTRHVGYLFRFKKNVDDLTKAKTDLELVQQKVQEAIERAAMKTEVVEKDVEKWLADVNQLLEEVQALENKVQVNLRLCNGWCPDWIRQYKLSKEVIQKTSVVKELQDKGKFSELTHRAPTPGIEIFSSSDFKVFESRNLAFQQIMEALHEDNNKGIGLYGMGGIGKTTLVKEVYKKVKELNIFNDIVMIVVSRTPDVRRIQGEIADCLHLKLEEESDTFRANRICLRIKSVEKILIIVDDVWESVELKHFGIPYPDDDYKGCRILLTTRRKNVCHLMLCHQRMISLNFLLQNESLALMKSIVGDNPDLNDVMLKVVEECKGLPIAISTVGKALKGKTVNEWNEAMYELRRSRLVDIEGVNEEKNTYVCIKWSYDQLKRKTKICFLLCSLFPEDYNIPIEELTIYAMGLEEDKNFHSLDEARSQVRAAINNLKDSSLLLEGSEKEFVKMHDMVRDIGLWITSEGKNEFELRAYTRLERNTNLERATAISLINCNTEQLPDNLVCPRLNILLLGRIQSSKEISNALFKGMNCLKVLTLDNKILSSQSLELLTNLRTLYLRDCNFSDDLSSLGKLKRLETLSFYKCEMVALPTELGEMASLKMLDLTDCYKLKWIPPNVIGRLSQLEELIIKGSFKNWDVEGTTSEISNAILSELNSLPRLVNLSLELNLIMYLPEGFVFPDLQRYFISINTVHQVFLPLHKYRSLRCINSRTLKIKYLNASSMNAMKSLFHTVEYIWIESCEMECIVDTTGGNHTATFGNLVELYLDDMSCLRTICEGLNQYEIFSNLTVLAASRCPRLISLFSPSLAQSLKKLKELSIHQCHEMKQIISEQGMILESHGQPICLPKLETLWVTKCGELDYIFPISVAQDLPQLERLSLQDLPQLKQVFGHEKGGDDGDGNNSVLYKLREFRLWNCPKVKLSFFANVEANTPALQKLQNLQILYVEDWNATSFDLMQGLSNLEELAIRNCGGIQEVIKLEGLLTIKGEQQELLLPRLEKMLLIDLHQLRCIWKGATKLINLNNLVDLKVIGCKKLEHLFTPALAQSLQKLKFLEIKMCDELEHLILENAEEHVSSERHLQPLCFPKL